MIDQGEADRLAADAIELCSRLIRFDTSNYGGGESRGEREAAEWVAEQLTDAGLAPTVLESAPGRANTVVRVPGPTRQRRLCSCTVTSTSSRPTRPSGVSRRSAVRCATTRSGAAALWT